MKPFRLLLAFAIGVAVLCFAAPSGQPAWAQSAPIKIGVLGPFKLTPGRDIQEAATLAVEEINADAVSSGENLS